MAQVIGSNIASHFPVNAQYGAQHSPPTVAGNQPAPYAVPTPNSTTINGVPLPKIDVRLHTLQNIIDFINNTVGGGVTASINRYGQLSINGPGQIVVGGDPGVRSALGI